MRNSFLFLILLGVLSCTPRHRVGPGAPVDPDNKPEAVSMSPVSYLRKVSLHIRGITPERSEYTELTKAIEKNQMAEFFKDKIAAYLKSREHIDKMSFRVEELTQVRASAVPYHSPLIAYFEGINFNGFVDPYTTKNSMNELVRRIADKNLSWDTLLTGKQYRAYPITGGLNFNLHDLLFFSDAAGLSPDDKVEHDVIFPPDDPRVAGIVTTGRFFSRNVTTALNKNRKRAAAVFRMFLCDDMKAVIVDEKGNQNEILDRVFPSGNGGGNAPQASSQVNAASGDIHGSDPACMKCHYKLDPMGRTFQDSGMILSKLASPGALVYNRVNGAAVNIPVSGVGGLAKAITEQPEYVNCQTGHFWRWFVGADVPLSPVVQAELNSKFEELGRKTNDFIAYLVTRPEFGFQPSNQPNGQMIAQVKGVLQNCNGCHTFEKIPSFTQWPIGGSPLTHQRWLGGIRKTMALDGSTAKRTMPPKDSSWQPSANQLQTLQRWFDLGAPNE